MRVITDASKAVLECRDYLPFGDKLLATSQNGRSGSCVWRRQYALERRLFR